MSSRAQALLAFFLLASGVQAQLRTDSLGDPLPEGAVARLGTLRFKHNPAQQSTVDVALFAPDGSRIVSLSQNNDSVRLWDAATGKELPGPWTAPHKRYNAVAFSPDSAMLAVAANMEFTDKGQARRQEITLYDLARARALKVISGINHHARGLASSTARSLQTGNPWPSK
jgi:WD40 repeat protein